jgi:2-polyprenyl-3-methyl-5-hydroxy-6-metoxy-1,4-benzoquinol methylase
MVADWNFYRSQHHRYSNAYQKGGKIMIDEKINMSAEAFWEDLYKRASPKTDGRPSQVLSQYVTGLSPGSALDLGCAKGDDCVWLAKQGWDVTGVDISFSALDIALQNAKRNEVSEQIQFEQHDLAKSFPQGSFDLVSAVFLQTPLSFPRVEVLRRAAGAVQVKGMLLITSHQKVAPWSWGDPSEEYPSARERLLELDLNPALWREIYVGTFERTLTNQQGLKASVTDAVVALERL